MISPQDKLGFLNEKFSASGHVYFELIAPDTIAAKLESSNSSVSIALFGATVVSYIPAGFGETLFLSKVGNFLPGKAIRGGIPLCWPWFGVNPQNANLPPHGFFRLLEWKVVEASHDSRESSIALSLCDSEESRKYWPHSFNAICSVSVGNQLKIKIQITNCGHESWSVGGVFHPYFGFADIRNVEIPSFTGQKYVDFIVSNPAETTKVQTGVLEFAGEVNQVYAYNGTVIIDDPKEDRQVSISNDSMESTGVWTPWQAKCAAAPDLGENDFTKFLCVEPGIIPPQARRIEPDDTFEAGITIEVSRFRK